ncbi:MAG: hypothetical protein ACRDLF_12825 [Solirubrobacteraceae bacterium]
MSRISTCTKNHGSAAVALVVVLLVCLGLGACGSSSGGSSSSASTPTAAKTTAEATPTTPSTSPASTTPASTTPTSTTSTSKSSTSEGPTITTHTQYLAALECMRHNGIKLPPFNQLSKYKITNEKQFNTLWKKCRYIVVDGHEPSGGESSGEGSG